MGKSPTAIATTDYSPGDRDHVFEAIQPVVSAMTDLIHHRTADGEWQPFAERGDTAGLASEARAVLDALGGPIKTARRELARIDKGARMRALARARRRPDLTGHCIIVETIDADTARKIRRPEAAGQFGIVECHDGRRGKVWGVADEIPPEVGIEDVARVVASRYGARYAGVVR
ncbi:hypothetical protein DP939_02780 [Spongiactinospora rosea]|uniref:Uncharacterized protein n=1 Tax=Spongiactinospora rosea TaxID=2248750 RepID=A0A366M7S6_9ACTN|nr:hypothetical protein [Spongiactinospora rosea]RBQ21654.1 hypothetical protein DP939_02780 [Spongiactinospora rosea]